LHFALPNPMRPPSVGIAPVRVKAALAECVKLVKHGAGRLAVVNIAVDPRAYLPLEEGADLWWLRGQPWTGAGWSGSAASGRALSTMIRPP
jgi:hypothetical protein